MVNFLSSLRAYLLKVVMARHVVRIYLLKTHFLVVFIILIRNEKQRLASKLTETQPGPIFVF